MKIDWIAFDITLFICIVIFFLMGESSMLETMLFGSIAILCIMHELRMKEDKNEKEG
jgi:hypothetical protein